MSQNYRPSGNINDLDPDIIKAVIQQQSQKIQLETSRLKLEEKRIEQETQIAERSLLLNSELHKLKNSPVEHRKTIGLYCLFIFLMAILLLGFILFCLRNGKDEFVNKFLNWLSHLIGIAAGFFVGRSTAKKKHPDTNTPSIQEAEEID